MNIAIVDDNHFLLQAIENKLGFYPDINIVWTADDAFEAQENLIKNHNLDLILMDIEMP